MADRIQDRALAEEASRLTEPPPFDALRARARWVRRRNRLATAFASAAAVLALVGTGALLTDTTTQRVPDPVDPPTPAPSRTPDPSPTPTKDVRTEAERLRELTPEQIVAEGRPYGYAANPDGSTLMLWRTCNRRSTICPVAWRLESAGGRVTTGGLPVNAYRAVYATGNGFVLKAPSQNGVLVQTDGQSQPVEIGDPPLPVEAGHVAVRDGDSFNVIDPQTGNAWALLEPSDVERIDSPVIDDSGRVWAIGSHFAGTSGFNKVIWTDDPEEGWQRFRFDTERNLPGRVVVAGDQVVATAVGDGATIAPIDKFAVSTDRGATWTVLEDEDLPFRQPYGMAATDGGVLLISDYAGVVWRSVGRDWTRFERLEEIPEIEALVPSGATVVGLTGSADPEFVRISDDGSFTTYSAR